LDAKRIAPDSPYFFGISKLDHRTNCVGKVAADDPNGVLLNYLLIIMIIIACNININKQKKKGGSNGFRRAV
jgi:hypothetical protein